MRNMLSLLVCNIFSTLLSRHFSVSSLDDDRALTLGGRLEFLSIDAEVKSKERDAASIIAARERFNKSADLSMVMVMAYLGITY